MKRIISRWMICGLLITLSLFFVTLGYTNPILPPEESLPPSIMPVMILKGSYYEMGYQYGQQAGEAMTIRKNLWWARGIRNFKTKEGVMREAKAYESQVKKFAPETIDIMKGMADGAKAAGYALDYTDVLLLNIAKALRNREGAAYPPDAGCGHIHAWGTTTKDGKLICTDNRDEEFTPQVAIIYLPDQGNAFFTAADTGQVACHPVMNNKGVFIGGSSGSARKEDVAKYGVPRPLALAHLGFTSNSAVEAKDWLVGHSTNWSGGINYSISDVKGNAFALETTPVSAVVRNPGDFGEVNFIFATNNALTKEGRKAGDSFGDNAEPRNEQIFNFLRNYQGKIDLEFLKMMYRNPGTPGLGNHTNNRVVIAMPDNGNKGLAYVCTGSVNRNPTIYYPMIAAWSIALPVNATYSFFELALMESPAKIVSAAQKTAEKYLIRTHVELNKKNYSNPEFAPLSAILSEAKSEYFKGIAAEANAISTKDRQSLYYFSRAATAYTKSQALAEHVYEELVPKARATTAEDLGYDRPKKFIRFNRPPHETTW